MPLDPRFAVELMKFLANPGAMVDISINLFFPEIAKEMGVWAALHGSQPSFLDTYDWLHKKFPASAERDPLTDPDSQFRELFKCIIATALDIEYKKKGRIII